MIEHVFDGEQVRWSMEALEWVVATLTDVQSKIQNMSDTVSVQNQSIVEVKAKLDSLVAAGTTPAADQAEIDAVASSLDNLQSNLQANNDALNALVAPAP